MTEIDIFNPKVKKIEDDIINFIMNSRLFSGKDTISLLVLGYFLTRRVLTQKDLKDLTGLSTGKISRELNRLIYLGYIEKQPTKGSQTHYHIKSAKLSLFPYISEFLNVVKKWELSFKQIKKQIEENNTEFEQYENFKTISEIVNFYLQSVPHIKSIINDMEKIK